MLENTMQSNRWLPTPAKRISWVAGGILQSGHSRRADGRRKSSAAAITSYSLIERLRYLCVETKSLALFAAHRCRPYKIVVGNPLKKPSRGDVEEEARDRYRNGVRR
jgi:hypothetical protein